MEYQETSSNRLRVRVAKKLYYSSENMWGIFSVVPVSGAEGFQPKLNSYGNMVIKGNTPIELKVKGEYDVEISDIKIDVKYGEYYEINRVHLQELNTVEAQQNFLEVIVSSHQYKLIIEAFPDCMIIDMIKNDLIDITTVKGIGKKTAKKIKEDIESNRELGALMVELSDFNFTGRMLNKIIYHFKGPALALYKVQQSLYNLCAVSGISFARVDDVALSHGEDLCGSKRIKAYSDYYFDEVGSQGHSWVSERLYLEQAIEALDINGKYIRDFLDSEEGQRSFFWNKKSKIISSRVMYENERSVLRNLLRISSRYKKPAFLNIERAIENAEGNLGIKYTDEQKNAIRESINHGVFILNGKGGTGKTTVVKGIVEVLTSIGLTYHSCALSGKASQVLLSKGIESSTLHRAFGIGMREEFVDGAIVDVIIVDESSMINAGLFRLMVEKIKNGAKIIIVGDSGQLSGIGHGDVLRDLLQTNYFKSIELKQIHRQAQDSGIIELASMIRDGEQPINSNLDGGVTFGKNKDMIIRGYSDREDIPEGIERILKGHLKNVHAPSDLMDFQIIVAMKERGDISARTINNLAQSIFNDLDKPSVAYNGYEFREGDKVIVKGNSYNIKVFKNIEHYKKSFNENPSEEELQYYMETNSAEEHTESFLLPPKEISTDLFNGTMGIVVDVRRDYDAKEEKEVTKLVVDFEGVGLKVFNQKELEVLELAYACTCHRLQGSTIKNVVVVLDYSAYTLLSRQWVYTAITRASNKCVLLAQSKALVRAISIDASGNRQTFLGNMIREVEQTKGSLQHVIEKNS